MIEFADGEVAVRAPKLRKIKSSLKSIQSSFGRLFVEETNKELYMKVDRLMIRFDTCQGEVEQLEIDFQIQEQKELNKLRAKVAFDRNLVRLQAIEASISDDSSEQEKQTARAKLAVLCMDYSDEDVEKVKIDNWSDLKFKLGSILYTVSPSLNQSFNDSQTGSNHTYTGTHTGSASNVIDTPGGANAGANRRRLEWKTLPTFDGDIGKYFIFKSGFQDRMKTDNIT